jgi:hypothetical protein
MGWAIRRPDGTYRGWNANAQDDALQPGEVYEERANPPEITTPKGPLPDHRAAARASLGALPERARTLALLHFLNLERAEPITEEQFNEQVAQFINRL